MRGCGRNLLRTLLCTPRSPRKVQAKCSCINFVLFSINDILINNLPLFLLIANVQYASYRQELPFKARALQAGEPRSTKPARSCWHLNGQPNKTLHCVLNFLRNCDNLLETLQDHVNRKFPGWQRVPSVTSRWEFEATTRSSPVSGCKGWNTISQATQLIQIRPSWWCFFALMIMLLAN